MFIYVYDWLSSSQMLLNLLVEGKHLRARVLKIPLAQSTTLLFNFNSLCRTTWLGE